MRQRCNGSDDRLEAFAHVYLSTGWVFGEIRETCGSSAGWAVKLPIRSCTLLAFGVSSRTSECFGRINMRSFLSFLKDRLQAIDQRLLADPVSLLVVVGKGLKLTRNRSVSHGLGSAE